MIIKLIIELLANDGAFRIYSNFFPTHFELDFKLEIFCILKINFIIDKILRSCTSYQFQLSEMLLMSILFFNDFSGQSFHDVISFRF